MEIKPITIYTGKTVPLFYDNIDTDQIIPKVHLKRVSNQALDLLLLMNGVTYLMVVIILILILINQNIMVRQF